MDEHPRRLAADVLPGVPRAARDEDDPVGAAWSCGRTGVRGANREALWDPAMSFRDAAGLIL